MSAAQHNIVNIPPGADFLPTLVDALLTGKLVEGFAPMAAGAPADPLALADVTIWVPTRRAARSLSTAFVERLGGQAAVLPRIVMLGDGDEEGLETAELIAGLEGFAAAAAQPVDGFTRTLILSRLVHGWASALRDNEREMMGGGDIIMPSSLADAIGFAGELGKLIDTMRTEEVEWAALEGLDVADHADWWQLTLRFLAIATTALPQILTERGFADGTRLRSDLLHRQAELYRAKGSAGPVIAAGSTGSIPATADLLKAVAALPQGALVLPGLDRDLDTESWQEVGRIEAKSEAESESEGAAPGHPQYGLKKLLASIDLLRPHHDIPALGSVDADPMRDRERIVAEALRPSSTTHLWRAFEGTFSSEQTQAAMHGVSLVEARNERQEALAIALALRDTIETEGRTAALVTPDRNLARRVAVEMRRFGIVIDDSAGQPLRNRPAGTLARLALATFFGSEIDPVALTALLKHPDMRLGLSRGKARHAARLLELAVLRGAVMPPERGAFAIEVLETKGKIDKDEKQRSYMTPAVARMSEEDWGLLLDFCKRLDAALLAVPDAEREGERPLDEWARQSTAFIEALVVDEHGELAPFYRSLDGAALHDLLADLLDRGDELSTTADHWPDVFDALLAPRAVRAQGGTDPRVAILGPLEARLQSFERVVLGGLNEGSWPATSRNDPFLSRPMKTALGLPPPERRTGLAAHDFQQMMGQGDVVLTRALRADNAPTVASRWVQRLALVAGSETAAAMRKRGQTFVDYAVAIDEPAERLPPATRPAPKPPVEVRPNRLSVTAVSRWIEDPYAIYAQYVLGLRPLDPLLRDADMRERGSLYHEVFEMFVGSDIAPDSLDAMPQLLAMAKMVFDEANVPQEFIAQWLPRFAEIGEAFLEWHAGQVAAGYTVTVEQSGRTSDGLDGFTLTARADRIDRDADGRFIIYDYKTGTSPTAARARDLKAPQLPLEAAMTARGAFGDELKGEVADFGYLRLVPGAPKFADMAMRPKDDAEATADEAWRRLAKMIADYREESQPYLSYNRPPKERRTYSSPYDHLARLGEWSNGAEDAS